MTGDVDETHDPWTVLSEQRVYENPWIAVDHREVLTPQGTPGVYGLVRFKKRAIGVVPVLDDGRVPLVGQWRAPLERYSWEVPTGGAEPGEAPEAAARRELLEETGYACAALQPIVWIDLSNSVTDEQGVVFLATGLTPGAPAPDDTEALAHRILPFAAVLGLVLEGTIRDSLTVAGVLRAHHMAVTGGMAPALAKAMLGR
jgi:8-oxo-dGTP pyrophosphatase MutT (NUDIX family)